MKDGVLTTERHLAIQRSEVPVEDYEAYKKFSKRVADDYGLTILLSSGPSHALSYESEIWELPMSENADAVRAYDDAREKFNKQDVQGGIGSLQRALEADPKFTRGWLWLGLAYVNMQQFELAIPFYRKALELDPEQLVCYKALALALFIPGKFEESAEVWRKMMKVFPLESIGPEMAAVCLMNLKRYAEAEAALEIAVPLHPDSSLVRFQLGSACLHAGDPQKAIIAFRKAVELDPKPFMLNNIAYELANAKGDLTVALDYTKRAVLEESKLSHEVDLGHLKVEDLEPTRALASYWDTLGWVYFRNGDAAIAEKYLHASWILSQNGAVADHLGQVYERENKKGGAIRMFEFSLVRSPESESKEDARDRIAHLGGSRFNSDLLPKIVDGEATAQFFLTFARDPKSSVATIEDVKFISGSEKLKSADKALKSAGFIFPLPPDGNPRLLRRGILGCYPLTGCSLTLLNPDDVRSVN